MKKTPIKKNTFKQHYLNGVHIIWLSVDVLTYISLSYIHPHV